MSIEIVSKLLEARAEDPSSVVDARYDSDADAIDLKFSGGGSMSIPRRIVPGLERAAESTIESVVVSPAGDALSWPSLDVDVYVPGLVERAFGTRLFAAPRACLSDPVTPRSRGPAPESRGQYSLRSRSP